jgi:predicted nucleic acid-binding protein
MMIIDTSVLIDALHKKETAIKRILELEKNGETLCTTQMNVLELYKGAFSPNKSEAGLAKVKLLLAGLVILGIN